MNKGETKIIYGLAAAGLLYSLLPKNVLYKLDPDTNKWSRLGRIVKVLLSPADGMVQYIVKTPQGDKTKGGSSELFKLKRF